MELVKNDQQQAIQTIKVLIADDDPPTRILLKAAISQWGYEVVEANDGEQAWDLLQQASAPNLLILDWLMPKLDGPGLCERIKQKLPQKPYIILLTQVSGTTNIIKGLEAGADEFLSKPFNMAELRSRLSVGSRIVNYKNEFAKQNKQISDYISQTNLICDAVLDTTQMISKVLDTQLPNNKNPEFTKKISELQNNLKELVEKLRAANLKQK